MAVDDAVSDLRLIDGVLSRRARGCRAARVADERPDVLLLDIAIPNRNGYEGLRGLKRDPRSKDTPVVFVSSKNQESDQVRGKRQRAADYFGKPLTSDDLLTVVRQLVG
jgi:twitching motility two-component system response regulator PilH